MNRLCFFIAVFVCLVLFSFSTKPLFAQSTLTEQKETFFTGSVVKIIQQGEQTIATTKTPYQIVQIKVLDGFEKGKILTLPYGKGDTTITKAQEVHAGDTVVLSYTQKKYTIYDTYRIPSLVFAGIIFFLLVVLVAGWKGMGSVSGLFVSLFIIFFYMLPQILHGANPLQVSVIASVIILFVTTYLAHGISKQTTIALLSTFLSLLITVWIASFFVANAQLTGLNSETATLLFGPTSTINMQGLLLAGIIIGTLGALNDITTTQAETIFSLAKHDENASWKKLFRSGFLVGREHIVSMVNTLVLAYAGSALALLLFIVLNPQHIPYWVILNNEDISDEIIRTLAGSVGLVLVVPIVTVFAAVIADRKIWRYVTDFIYAFTH